MLLNLSSVFGEAIPRDHPFYWNRLTPIDCNTVRILGILLCLVGFVGMMLNGILLCSFLRYRNLRTPPNIFIIYIVAIGLVASCSILPTTGSSSIYCYWLFGRRGCQFEALMAFLYGCSSSYLLCAVSLSRCYIIIQPFHAKSVTVNKCIVIASIAVLIAFIWTILPIVGWNEYTLEGIGTSCCINWYDRRRLFVSFNLFLFVFVYCIPLLILLVTNTIIYVGLKQMKKKIEQGIPTGLNQRKIEMERRILKSILITIFGFLFTWTPYAIVFFICAFYGKQSSLSPLSTFICACFAKSSVMWIPMLYISTSTHFKITFVNQNALDKHLANSVIEAPHMEPIKIPKNHQTPAVAVVEDFSPIGE